MAARPVWIFGYGSLVWRPAFPHAERRPALLQGWIRRFWQGSTDHRGHPAAPGRVVTLVRDPEGQCHGTAYRLEADRAQEVLVGLDVRERGGYERHCVGLRLLEPDVELGEALVYVATPRNPNYLGPARPSRIAAQILRSRGPSGPNLEYLLKLAEALRAMGADDPHVFELEALARGEAVSGAD